MLPAAGIHGLVRRDAEGLLHTGEIDDQAMVGVMAEVTPIAVAYPQILIETKPSAVALHYRAHPKLEGVCKAAAQRIAAGRPNLQVLHGKMVVEIKPKGPHKGTAIKGFMAEPPFSGRCPIYFGDDTTDEDAFLAVNALGGMSIKVGAGKTVARNRVAGPAELHAWLASLASAGWAPLPAA